MATWVARRRGVAALRRARLSSQALLPKEHPIKKFDKCDFGPLREWVARDRELKKAKTDDEKKEAKVEKDKTLLQNGYAIMDGRLEKVRRVLPSLSLAFGSSLSSLSWNVSLLGRLVVLSFRCWRWFVSRFWRSRPPPRPTSISAGPQSARRGAERSRERGAQRSDGDRNTDDLSRLLRARAPPRPDATAKPTTTPRRRRGRLFAQMGNYNMEPPSLFRGRGKHPKTGTLKQRVAPEQVRATTRDDSRDVKIDLARDDGAARGARVEEEGGEEGRVSSSCHHHHPPFLSTR